MKKMTNLFKNFKKVLLLAGVMISPNTANAVVKTQGFVFDNPIFNGDNNKNIFQLVSAILDFVVKAGTVVVIFMVIYSGFLFVKAQGNESEVETAKKTFYWTVIGGVVLIGARVLAGVICNTANGLGAGANCSGLMTGLR